jgi:hypothetical protein
MKVQRVRNILILAGMAVLIVLGIWLASAGGSEPISDETGTESAAVVGDEQPTPELLPDSQAQQVMYILANGPNYEAALETVLEAQDTRFIAVFIELMRANQIGLLQGAGQQAHIRALETLSGETFGGNWAEWIEWYGATDLVPPPGFTTWKGQLLGGIDPRFEDFLLDGHPSTIRTEEIQWGGVMVDGIPALDNPTMISPDEAGYLEPEEPVFGISINGDHRAYPLRILDWHEMANDVVGGVPVSLAYCTLCGAGIAYHGLASDGEVYTFGSSGFLFRSNKLMYDRQTRTLWNQLTGEPVLGELVGSGIKLELLPVVLTSWADWLEQHPDTKVLDISTGYSRPYDLGAAYGGYFASEDLMFPVWQRSDLLEDKARIYALQVEGIPKAYPVANLIEEQVVNDRIGGTNLVVVAARGDVTVEPNPIVRYNAGGEVRAFQRGEQTFRPGTDPDTLLDDRGVVWLVTESALVSLEGESLARINGHLAYWFGWFSFFPNTLLYGQE